MSGAVSNDRRRKRRYLLFLAFALLLCYVGALRYLAIEARPGSGSRLWDGYFTLAVPDRFEEEIVLSLLASAGITDVVTESRTTVLVAAFSHIEEVALPSIDRRLEPEDPRYDPYIAGVRRLFFGDGIDGRYRLFYLDTEAGAVTTMIALRRALSNRISNWFVADVVGLHRWVAAVGVFGVALFLATIARGHRLLLVAMGLPWLVGSLAVGGSWTAFSGAVLTGAYFLVISGGEAKSTRFVVGIGIILLVTICVASSGAVPAAPAVASLGATLAIYGASAAFARRRALGRDHHLFVPLGMVPDRRRADAEAIGRAMPIAPGLLLLSVVLALLPAGRDITVPSPREAYPTTEEDAPREAALRRLWEETRDDPLPNLSDLVAHVAFQEGFSYGREYGFPDSAMPLTVLEIREEEGRLVEKRRIAAVYDRRWFSEVLESIPPGSVGQLLLHQPVSTGVVSRPLAGLYSQSSHLITYSAVLLVSLSPMVFGALTLRLRGARARGSRSLLGRLNHGLAPYVPQGGNSSI